MIRGEPSFPSRKKVRSEAATKPRDDFDADRFRFKIGIDDQSVRQFHRIVDRPLLAICLVDGTRESAHRLCADVVKAQILIPAKIALGVEFTGWPGHSLERALNFARTEFIDHGRE